MSDYTSHCCQACRDNKEKDWRQMVYDICLVWTIGAAICGTISVAIGHFIYTYFFAWEKYSFTSNVGASLMLIFASMFIYAILGVIIGAILSNFVFKKYLTGYLDSSF